MPLPTGLAALRQLVKIDSERSPLIQPNMVFASLADWQNSGWYYRTTAKQLIRTFWGNSLGTYPLSRNIISG